MLQHYQHSFSSAVAWGSDGKSFVVKRQELFARTVLPQLFRHNNYSSFIRQLNKYGFHKMPLTDDMKMAENLDDSVSTEQTVSNVILLQSVGKCVCASAVSAWKNLFALANKAQAVE